MGKLTAKAAHDNSADIYIFDDIGGNGITAKEFTAELRELGNVNRLRIHINSLGGSLFEGLTIYTVLSQHAAFKTTLIEGVAASIASIIAMSGDEVHIAADGMLMLHNPWTSSTGDAAELQKSVDLLEKTTDRLVNVYTRRTGADPMIIRDMMEKETWLSAAEAADLGFVDFIFEPTKLAAQADFTRFANAPHFLAREYGIAAHGGRVQRNRIVARNRVNYAGRRTAELVKQWGNQ
jgi:ATP-dependent protease ClpP protease subunit